MTAVAASGLEGSCARSNTLQRRPAKASSVNVNACVSAYQPVQPRCVQGKQTLTLPRLYLGEAGSWPLVATSVLILGSKMMRLLIMNSSAITLPMAAAPASTSTCACGIMSHLRCRATGSATAKAATQIACMASTANVQRRQLGGAPVCSAARTANLCVAPGLHRATSSDVAKATLYNACVHALPQQQDSISYVVSVEASKRDDQQQLMQMGLGRQLSRSACSPKQLLER